MGHRRATEAPSNSYWDYHKRVLQFELPHFICGPLQADNIESSVETQTRLAKSLQFRACRGEYDLLPICAEAGMMTPKSLCAILATVPESSLVKVGWFFDRAAAFLTGGTAAVVGFDTRPHTILYYIDHSQYSCGSAAVWARRSCSSIDNGG
ncbi:hypothetical protein BC828DRAFT_375129 [Blastocladiella britannica]|nr:hypothetical protein BC828DRAFT_375129 [Blastocladiella britannica]